MALLSRPVLSHRACADIDQEAQVPAADHRKTPRHRRVCNSSGQDLIEYAILAAFISVVAIAGASLMGTSINDWFTSVAAVVEKGKKSNCSATGFAESDGKCQ